MDEFKVTLKGREIPLIFTTLELKNIQEEIGKLDDTMALVMGTNPDDAEDTSRFGSVEHLNALAKAVRIMGNAGLEESGEKPDLTERWILRAMRPKDVLGVALACMNTLTDGIASEIEEEEKQETEGRTDIGLQEIEKKEEPGS